MILTGKNPPVTLRVPAPANRGAFGITGDFVGIAKGPTTRGGCRRRRLRGLIRTKRPANLDKPLKINYTINRERRWPANG